MDPQEDWVRHDLEIAFGRGSQTRVLPVPVDGAALPSASKLPARLAPLPGLQAVFLREERFDDDVRHLIEAVEEAAARAVAPLPPGQPRAEPPALGDLR